VKVNTSNEIHDNNLALVIAGSYSEYLNWRKDNPLVKYCKYIERVEDLQGINGFLANIVLYGNYENSAVYQTRKMHSLLAEHTSPFRAYVH
jgi:hypothetical protein